MKLKFSKSTSVRVVNRLKKKVRIRKNILGSEEKPRLCVYRSGKHMYAQIVNDDKGQTLFSASSLNLDAKLSGKDQAKEVGKTIAKLALDKKITSVVFDRNGFIYHGRVQALADGAREAGLQF